MLIENIQAHFELSEEQLNKLLFSPLMYREIQIPKSTNGYRTLRVPVKELKEVLRYVLGVLTSEIKVNPKYTKNQIAYTKGRSCIDYSEMHKDKLFIVKLDIKDYFDQITFPRVVGVLKKNHIRNEDAVVIAQLACYRSKIQRTTKHIAIAQGSPLSPFLSNIVSTSIDAYFQTLLVMYPSVVYSRYADDITLSTNDPMSFEFVKDETSNIYLNLEKRGFQVNKQKTKYVSRGVRLVGGLRVNQKLNLPIGKLDDIRINLNYAKRDFEQACERYVTRYRPEYVDSTLEKKRSYFSISMLGKLNYLRNVKGVADQVFQKYAKKFNEIDKFGFKIDRRTDRDFKAIVCIEFLDLDNIDSIGNGFFISDIGLITCYHNIGDINKHCLFHKRFKIGIQNREGTVKLFNTSIKLDWTFWSNHDEFCAREGYVYVDYQNDVLIFSFDYLARHIYNYESLESEIEPYPIDSMHVTNPFQNALTTKSYIQIRSDQNEMLEKNLEFIRFDYNRFLINGYVGQGASGSPIFCNDGKVFGIYTNGTDSSPNGQGTRLGYELREYKSELEAFNQSLHIVESVLELEKSV